MSKTDHHSITRAPYGVLPTGEQVESFALRAGNIHLECITYGATITSLHAPDRHGDHDDVVLGHDTLDGYLSASPYFGAVVGRCANRIAFGRFTLDDVDHQLSINNGLHHLHGGVRGFDKVVWSAEVLEEAECIGVRFSYESADGEEGYPGAVRATVTYRLSQRNELECEYRASATAATPVNLTQHTYWNLSGARAATIMDHELVIHADAFTTVDAGLIPTGEQRQVAATSFDFRQPRPIGARIDDDELQLARAGGYDHNFVLRHPYGTALSAAAVLHDPLTGRTLDISTTEPGLQFYSGNFLDGSITGKGGRSYPHRGGLCLETQHFPDSPNQPAFPACILRPGAAHLSKTVFAFSASR